MTLPPTQFARNVNLRNGSYISLLRNRAAFARSTVDIRLNYEPHVEFKKRVPSAIGLIRTADTIQYANMILVSA